MILMIIYENDDHDDDCRFFPAGKSTIDFRNKKRNNTIQQQSKAASVGMNYDYGIVLTRLCYDDVFILISMITIMIILIKMISLTL